jgi:hypothetical protein
VYAYQHTRDILNCAELERHNLVTAIDPLAYTSTGTVHHGVFYLWIYPDARARCPAIRFVARTRRVRYLPFEPRGGGRSQTSVPLVFRASLCHSTAVYCRLS